MSKQNELLVSAFKESGVGAGQFPVAKLAPDTQIERLKGAMLVPIAFSNGKPVSTFVRSKLDGVEQATLILIVEGRIGLVTKIALYR